MPITRSIEWLNHNGQRRYPFTDAASLRDTQGVIQLPNDFIVALQLPIHAGLAVFPHLFYLQELIIAPIGFTIVIGYNDGDTNPQVAAAHVPTIVHTTNRTYALGGLDDFADSNGQITIGSLDNISKLPAGRFLFTAETAPIDSDSIRPMIRGITSITVVNGQDESEKLYGDIRLTAGRNMQLEGLADYLGLGPRITFSAIDGAGLNEECDCNDEQEGVPIRFLNGIPPQPNGNALVVGSTCLNIVPITNGLLFEDTCSEPCCDCVELAALTDQIDRFADGEATVRLFISELRSQVGGTLSSILGSRLGDTQCVDCG